MQFAMPIPLERNGHSRRWRHVSCYGRFQRKQALRAGDRNWQRPPSSMPQGATGAGAPSGTVYDACVCSWAVPHAPWTAEMRRIAARQSGGRERTGSFRLLIFKSEHLGPHGHLRVRARHPAATAQQADAVRHQPPSSASGSGTKTTCRTPRSGWRGRAQHIGNMTVCAAERHSADGCGLQFRVGIALRNQRS